MPTFGSGRGAPGAGGSCGAEATTAIKRSEWGMTDGVKIGNPGDEIGLVIPVEAYRDQS